MTDDEIKVEKEYFYPRKYVTKDGEVKVYNQRITKTVYATNDLDQLRKEFNKGLNEILQHSVTLNKLNRIRKTILKNKCYGKKNFIQSVNKVDQSGELGEKTRELLNKCHKHQYRIAEDMEASLELLISLYESEIERITKFNEELKEIDKESFEAQ